jgi:D-alanine-D-alanine ligase
MNKIIQKKILQQHAITVPQSITITPDQIHNFEYHKHNIFNQLEAKHVTLPYIVKPYKEGSSIGISAVHNKEELYKALTLAMKADPHRKQDVLIEEKIIGMEFSCIILTDNTTGELMPLPPTEIVIEQGSDFYDYEQKYMPGRAHKITPARVSSNILKKIQNSCVQTMRALEFTTIARIDGILTINNDVVIIDPNSLSGMAPSSFLFREAAEINMGHTQLINHLIETELRTNPKLSALKQPENKIMIQNKPKLSVAVLCGGDSNEKEISLESGRNVVYKLSPTHYNAIPIFVTYNMELYTINTRLLVHNSTAEITQELNPANKIKWADLPTITDFVFNALHGGKGENGSVQGTLEMLGVPYNGSSVLASALCMDKYKTNKHLQHCGFYVPQSCLISSIEWLIDQKTTLKNITSTLKFPLIAKPHNDGCSVMVKKINNKQELCATIDQLFVSKKHYALIEEMIVGMELTIGVIGNDTPQALPPSQAVTTKTILSMEEKFLPGAGENQTPAPLNAQALKLVQQTVEKVYTAVGCAGYARIDCFYQDKHQSPTNKERVVIIEINTLPALPPATCLFHQAAEINIKPMELIDTIVQLGIEKHTHNTNSVALVKKQLLEKKEVRS